MKNFSFKNVKEKPEFNFIEIVRKYGSTGPILRKDVTVCFTKVKKNGRIYLRVNVPSKICAEAKLARGDNILVSYDESNPRILLLKKVKVGGYKLGGANNNHSFSVSVPWTVFTPEDADFHRSDMKHEFYDGGIMIW